jgi:hypothetical protein
MNLAGVSSRRQRLLERATRLARLPPAAAPGRRSLRGRSTSARTARWRGLTPDIVEAAVPRHGVLRLRFADGLTGDVEVLDRMRGPVFERARTPEGFAKVSVDPETARSSGRAVPIWHRTRCTNASAPGPGQTKTSRRSSNRRAIRRLSIPATHSVRFQSPNPRDLTWKIGGSPVAARGKESRICREDRPLGVASGPACHAEGRGFESFRRFAKRCRLQVFSFTRSLCSSASRRTHSGLAADRLPAVPRRTSGWRADLGSSERQSFCGPGTTSAIPILLLSVRAFPSSGSG